MYMNPSKWRTVLSISTWKFWKFRRCFRPRRAVGIDRAFGAIDSNCPSRSKTSRIFQKFSCQKWQDCPSFRWVQVQLRKSPSDRKNCRYFEMQNPRMLLPGKLNLHKQRLKIAKRIAKKQWLHIAAKAKWAPKIWYGTLPRWHDSSRAQNPPNEGS